MEKKATKKTVKKAVKKVVKKKTVKKTTTKQVAKKTVKSKKSKHAILSELHVLVTARAHKIYLGRDEDENDHVGDWLKAESEIKKELQLI